MKKENSSDSPIKDATLLRPTKLYKYCPIGERLFELLECKKLYFAHQRQLNDPQDCRYSIGPNLREDIFGRSLKEMHADAMARLNGRFPMCEQHFDELMRPLIFSDAWQTEFEEKMLFGELGWGVCCFSEDPINELMWSHYAKSHSGVCLEFDFSHTPSLRDKLWPVRYASAMPVLDSFDELPDALLTKNVQWSYEREWRILKMFGGCETFEPQSITAIYFGAKADKNMVDQVIETCKSNMYAASFFNVKLARGAYALTLDLHAT